MSRLVFPLVAALAMALALVPSTSAASPCATPCGEVTVVFDCVTFTATGEGAGGGLGTQWSLVVHESTYGWGRTTTVTGTGPAVALQHSGIAAYLGYYKVTATLYADGNYIDSESWACIA